MAFQNLKAGDKIRFRMRGGMSLVNGRAMVDMVEKTAPVQQMLVFDDHVVVNLGGRHGTPHVVNASNFIRKVSK